MVTARSSGPNESVVPPWYQQIEPAETPASTTPASHTAAQDRVEVVHPPHGEQVGHRPAVDPDHVLGQQVPLDVLEVGHREQGQVGEVEAGHPRRLAHVVLEAAVVPARRADVADPGDAEETPDSSTA